MPNIQEQYIEGTWVDTLWSGNLVDVVNGIFNVASTAVGFIKNGLSTAWNGVKAGLAFVGNLILNALLGTIVIAVNLMITSILEIAKLFTSISYTKVGSQYNIDLLPGKTVVLEISKITDGIYFKFGDIELNLNNLFKANSNIETLSIASEVAATVWDDIISSVLSSSLARVLLEANRPSLATGIMAGSIVYRSMTWLNRLSNVESNYNQTEVDQYLGYLISYHAVKAISILVDYTLNKPGADDKTSLLGLILIWVLETMIGPTIANSVNLNSNLFSLNFTQALFIGSFQTHVLTKSYRQILEQGLLYTVGFTMSSQLNSKMNKLMDKDYLTETYEVNHTSINEKYPTQGWRTRATNEANIAIEEYEKEKFDYASSKLTVALTGLTLLKMEFAFNLLMLILYTMKVLT